VVGWVARAVPVGALRCAWAWARASPSRGPRGAGAVLVLFRAAVCPFLSSSSWRALGRRGARRDSRFLSSSALAGPQQSGSLLFLVLGSARRTLGTLAAFFLEMAEKRELANAVVLLPGLLRWCQCQRAHGNQPTGMGARQPRRPTWTGSHPALALA